MVSSEDEKWDLPVNFEDNIKESNQIKLINILLQNMTYPASQTQILRIISKKVIKLG